jgi:hypothetical protein
MVRAGTETRSRRTCPGCCPFSAGSSASRESPAVSIAVASSLGTPERPITFNLPSTGRNALVPSTWRSCGPTARCGPSTSGRRTTSWPSWRACPRWRDRLQQGQPPQDHPALAGDQPGQAGACRPVWPSGRSCYTPSGWRSAAPEMGILPDAGEGPTEASCMTRVTFVQGSPRRVRGRGQRITRCCLDSRRVYRGSVGARPGTPRRSARARAGWPASRRAGPGIGSIRRHLPGFAGVAVHDPWAPYDS